MNAGTPAALFSSAPIYALWSYSIYLLHPLLQRPRDVMDGVLRSHLPPNLAATISAPCIGVVLFTVSRAAYHGIEAPGRRAV
jgi:peptidoglycan/LPS O-acetylase OafA/YrhL